MSITRNWLEKWEVATVISVRITLSYCKVQREAELIYGKYNYSPLTNAIYVFGRHFDSFFFLADGEKTHRQKEVSEWHRGLNISILNNMKTHSNISRRKILHLPGS